MSGLFEMLSVTNDCEFETRYPTAAQQSLLARFELASNAVSDAGALATAYIRQLKA